MNAPANPLELGSLHMNIELDLLIPSRTNPRKRKGFDDKSLNDLAQSIVAVGIAQPILVREMIDVATFEIIAGERRWRAAQRAGLNSAPCIVRNLTDLDVLKVQLIENKQREDLDELEEAEGYEKLMQEKDAAGNAYTADLIAETMGVSRSTIYGRLTLLKLCPEAREAFYQGVLDASRALLIARIPSHKNQLSALKKITNAVPYGTQWLKTGDIMSYRRARDLIQEDYMLDLDHAPFDTKDAELLPKAGSCKECPKRTGNQPELFDDVKSKDVCTDPSCHALKKTAHVLAIQQAAEAKGHEVIIGKAAKKLMPNQYSDKRSQLRESGYATLDTPVPGDEQKRTLGQVLKEAKLTTPVKDTGKPAVQKTMIEDPHNVGKLIETVNIETATKALREAGFEITLKGKSQQSAAPDNSKQREKEQAQLDIENAWRARLFDTLHQQIEAGMADPKSTIFPLLYRMLAEMMFEWVDADEDDIIKIISKFGAAPAVKEGEAPDLWSHIRKFQENIPKLTTQQHFMLISDLMFADELSTNWNSRKPDIMLTVAKEVGIDAESMKKEVAAEGKEKQKAAADAAKKPEAKKASTTKKAAKAA